MSVLYILYFSYILHLCCDSTLGILESENKLSESLPENRTTLRRKLQVDQYNKNRKRSAEDWNLELPKEEPFENKKITGKYLNLEKNQNGGIDDEITKERNKNVNSIEQYPEEILFKTTNIHEINNEKPEVKLNKSLTKILANGVLSTEYPKTASTSFSIDYDKGVFLLNGKEFVMISGRMQYYRIPRPYWRDRLRSMKDAGVNTLHMSIEWSTHEPTPNRFSFVGDEDFVLFTRLAQEEGLCVVVCPGPFIGDERDFGGLPAWLLWEPPGMKLLGNDARYESLVSRYLLEVLVRLRRLLVEHGGPVVMVELEVAADVEHSTWLARKFREHLGDDVIIVTSERNSHPGLQLVSTSYLDFMGIRIFNNLKDTRKLTYSVRKLEPNGPWIASHVIGVGSLWGYTANHMSGDHIAEYIKDSLVDNKSISINSFHGGTDFGFKSGAVILPLTGRYAPHTTSHDLGAPLDEAGNPTDKYAALRDAIQLFFPPLERHPIPPVKPGVTLRGIRVHPVACLLDSRTIATLAVNSTTNVIPLTFEQLRQSSGFVLYETKIRKYYSTPLLRTPELRDRAVVYVNSVYVGVLSRSTQSLRLYLPDLTEGARVQIVVENQGRSYWQPDENMHYYKGLAYSGDVRLADDLLADWTMHGYPMDEVPRLHQYVAELESRDVDMREVRCAPTLYAGEFQLPSEMETSLLDTYLDLSGGWIKGVAFINNHNLGRYWPRVGPQETLYIPGCFLLPYPQKNKLIILDLERIILAPIVNLEDHHITGRQSRPVRRIDVIAMFVLMFTVLLMLKYAYVSAAWIRGGD